MQTCKAFQVVMSQDAGLWRRVLHALSLEQSIAPHSLEHLSSASDLMTAATRYTRMRAALSDHRLPLSIRVDHYLLDHRGIFDSASAKFMPLTLLPGGRWLLSLAIHDGSSYVVCWDVRLKAFHDSDPVKLEGSHYSLRPAAYLELKNVNLVAWEGSWAQVQATTEADGVIIAVRSEDEVTDVR